MHCDKTFNPDRVRLLSKISVHMFFHPCRHQEILWHGNTYFSPFQHSNWFIIQECFMHSQGPRNTISWKQQILNHWYVGRNMETASLYLFLFLSSRVDLTKLWQLGVMVACDSHAMATNGIDFDSAHSSTICIPHVCWSQGAISQGRYLALQKIKSYYQS